ncbi:MAG: flagellar motor switch phosphatase FliY [Oscillospiraceae bacterium]|nr:flagellar motor switch phosphatase FliY [Oscillospiraceae bacterium]
MINTKANDVMENTSLSPDETDAIGEILNISMGAAATAISIMLDRQVNITTPNVKVVQINELEYKELEPAVGVEIEYIEGLYGSNIMIMSIRDVKKIVDLLIGSGGDESITDDNLDEIQKSALGEIMNQMMGSSCTALASFLNTTINISTPKPLDVSHIKEKLQSSSKSDHIVSICFKLQVENLLDSEFMTAFPIEFTKELIQKASVFDESGNNTPSDSDNKGDTEIPTVTGHVQVPDAAFSDERVPAQPAAKVNTEPPAAAKKPSVNNPQPAARSVREPPKSTKNVSPLQFGSLGDENSDKDTSSQVDLGLVLGVELNVTVEIGRQKKLLKDVLALRQGSVVELDKQAGEPVDVMVNGQLIARGDVVVIDDNFGVRITEIINKPEN